MKAFLTVGVLLSSLAQAAHGAFTNIPCSADTTLSENYPHNNFGGQDFVNSGTTQNFTRNRALFWFDIAGALPAGARVTRTALVLEVVKEPGDGYAFADFGLHRVNVSWGEGEKVSPTNSLSAGTGALATANEATWHDRYALTTNAWSLPGAGPGWDYAALPSAIQTIYGVGDSPYVFGPSTELNADVQLWLDQPARNFGWILVCQSEAVDFTARRFSAREDPEGGPLLRLDYLLVPQIQDPQRVGTHFTFWFTAVPGQAYTLEQSESVAPYAWQLLAEIAPQDQAGRVVFVDSAAPPARFYRVSTR